MEDVNKNMGPLKIVKKNFNKKFIKEYHYNNRFNYKNKDLETDYIYSNEGKNGDATDGVLGVGNTAEQNTWVKTGISGISKAIVGARTSYVLTSDNSIYTAGDNFFGQLGLGHTTSPIAIWSKSMSVDDLKN